MDLLREFPCRGEHQDLRAGWTALVLFGALLSDPSRPAVPNADERREEEAAGLAAAGLRHGHNILALEGQRPCLRLDWRRLSVPLLSQGSGEALTQQRLGSRESLTGRRAPSLHHDIVRLAVRCRILAIRRFLGRPGRPGRRANRLATFSALPLRGSLLALSKPDCLRLPLLQAAAWPCRRGTGRRCCGGHNTPEDQWMAGRGIRGLGDGLCNLALRGLGLGGCLPWSKPSHLAGSGAVSGRLLHPADLLALDLADPGLGL
mmetsp:Transcript_80400/g.206924  ORF Transcript_80400/g.206924 Transcript_80400/m.206924 type:complete len:261 (-) Transcript_80400:223-1005(-)